MASFRSEFAISLLVPAVVGIAFIAGCSSPPPPEPPKEPPPKYVPPPVPPLEDLQKQAIDAEKVGNEIKNFNCIIGLEEAIRANQRIVDNYPQSDSASPSREKIKDLGDRVRRLRAWKKSLDGAAGQIRTVSANPAGAHATFEALGKMLEEAPEGFVREETRAVLDRYAAAYREGALRETGKAAAKAEELVEKGDFRAALSHFAKLPPEFGSDLPDVGDAIRDRRAGVDRKVSERAQEEIARAERALQKKQEREAVQILRNAWEKYLGYPAAEEILKLERKTVLVRVKVATAEATGNVRKTDLELFQLMESGVEILPGQPDFVKRMARKIQEYRELPPRYLSGVDQLWCTRKEYEVRKSLIDQVIAREEQVLQAGR
jgi:hypothetical protein